MGAPAGGDDGGGAPPGQPHQTHEPGGIGPVAQARAGDRDPARRELLEVGAAAVECDHTDVEAEIGEARHQGGPLPLGAAGLEVRADEHDPLRRAHAAPAASVRRYTASTCSAIGPRP